MKGHNPHEPWLFFRDEVDLLEAEYDQIFVKHEATKNDPGITELEKMVIKEQQQTESQAEVDIDEMIDIQLTDPETRPPSFASTFRAVSEESLSLKSLLGKDVQRHVAYEISWRWSREVFAWSQKQYYQKARKNQDIFRVHINACLVPAKILFAQSEEAIGDNLSRHIAVRELELAKIYLERTVDSLKLLASNGDLELPQWKQWYAGARQIMDFLSRKLNELKQHDNRS